METMHTPREISIVIPAYNEEHGILPVLDQITDILAATTWTYEIIVVDDGSRDRTTEVLASHHDITLIQHVSNHGYGASLKTGIRHAQYSLVCITDADGSYPNEQIIPLAEHLLAHEYDMVVGARTGENVAIPLVRRPAKWFIGQMANFVGNQRIPDINSGLRVFRRPIAMSFQSLLPNGFSFTTTITLGMLVNNYLVDFLPINYHPRIGKSKIRPFHDTLNFMQLILRIGLYFAPLKLFLPLSGIILVIAIMWGMFTHMVLGRLADVSTMVLVMAALQIAAIGLLAELINHRIPSSFRKEIEEQHTRIERP